MYLKWIIPAARRRKRVEEPLHYSHASEMRGTHPRFPIQIDNTEKRSAFPAIQRSLDGADAA
jgi:hypothetical protein